MREHEEFRQCDNCGKSGRGPDAPPLVEVSIRFPDSAAMVSTVQRFGKWPPLDASKPVPRGRDQSFTCELCGVCVENLPIIKTISWVAP